MALTNLILTVVGVGAAVMLLRKDVKQSSAVFRRNIRHIKTWLEEESAATTYAHLPLLACSLLLLFTKLRSNWRDRNHRIRSYYYRSGRTAILESTI